MKKWFLSPLPACAAALLLGVCSVAAAEQDLTFDTAWIRAMPPGMMMTAGFGRLHNASAETIELTGFASPQFGDVSLHRTELVDGVSRMREITSLSVAAGETIELAPGGYHLMLMQPAGSTAAGQTITVEIISSDGRSFDFDVPVERR